LITSTSCARRRALLVLSCVLAGGFGFVPAVVRAWYFPEHAELSRLALRDFAPGFATEVIQLAVADAAADGLVLCPGATTALPALDLDGEGVRCVSYGVLAALAADHSNTTADLRDLLSRPLYRPWPAKNVTLGSLLAAAAQRIWNDFQTSVPEETDRVWTGDVSRVSASSARLPRTLSPRDLVRVLDVQLTVLDPGYVDRAKNAKTHFHDPTRSVELILQQAALGDLDNALAQALAHHARSLQLAVLSRPDHEPDADIRRRLRTEALLEHAFAVHFVQDGFAAGHIVTDPAVAAARSRTQRHDYFNREGLAVTRALSPDRCQAQPPFLPGRGVGLDACWVAHGDGFASADDRMYANEAVARLQTAFALALSPRDPAWVDSQLQSPQCESWIAGNGDVRAHTQCDVAWTAALLDPRPAWIGAACKATPADWARMVLGHFQGALQQLADQPLLAAADAGSPAAQPGALTRAMVGIPTQSVARTPEDLVPVPAGGSSLDGAVDPDALKCAVPDAEAALWMPLLAAWPAAQADATTLQGQDAFANGWAVQAGASAAVSDTKLLSDSASVSGWAGATVGLTYLAQGILPYVRTRGLFELNAGFAQGVRLAGPTDAFRSLGVLEMRVPLTSLLAAGAGALWHSARPMTWFMGGDVSGGLLGARAYTLLAPNRMLFYGWDAEVLNVLLSPSAVAQPARRSGVLEAEGRLRLGVRSSDPSRPLRTMFGGSFVLMFEVSVGLFSYL
jgi:hypothetical protein